MVKKLGKQAASKNRTEKTPEQLRKAGKKEAYIKGYSEGFNSVILTPEERQYNHGKVVGGIAAGVGGRKKSPEELIKEGKSQSYINGYDDGYDHRLDSCEIKPHSVKRPRISTSTTTVTPTLTRHQFDENNDASTTDTDYDEHEPGLEEEEADNTLQSNSKFSMSMLLQMAEEILQNTSTTSRVSSRNNFFRTQPTRTAGAGEPGLEEETDIATYP